jgi:tRNA pseudouridine38-40 synthase
MAAGSIVKDTVRTIYKIDIEKACELIDIVVEGNGFLYNMVRIIVGTLIYTAIDRIPAKEMADIIDSCDRNRAGITAPAHGLYLEKVFYE